jgi:hypothetical protein
MSSPLERVVPATRYDGRVVWEVVFMLVLLKIPLVYLCMVVWWAIRAEPREEQPVIAVPVPDTPASPNGWSRPTRERPAPGGRRGPRPGVGPAHRAAAPREARP